MNIPIYNLYEVPRFLSIEYAKLPDTDSLVFKNDYFDILAKKITLYGKDSVCVNPILIPNPIWYGGLLD